MRMSDICLIVQFPEIEGVDLEEGVMDLCGDLTCEGGGTLLGGTGLNPGHAMRDLEFWGPTDEAIVEAANNVREFFEKNCPPLYLAECKAEIEDIEDEEEC
jgi:hypothetical protein